MTKTNFLAILISRIYVKIRERFAVSCQADGIVKNDSEIKSVRILKIRVIYKLLIGQGFQESNQIVDVLI